MSTSLWIPFIWVSINGSRALTYWFSSGTSAAESGDVTDGSPIDRAAYLLLFFAGLAILANRSVDWARINHKFKWIWVLYAYYLTSTLWSDYPFVAFKRWVKDIGDVVMILIIVTEKNPSEAVRAVFMRFAYLLIPVSVLFIKWYPELGRYTHRWTYKTMYSGITTNKNALGLAAMIAGIFLIWQIVDLYRKRGIPKSFRNSWPDWVVLGMCVWLLSLADSATSLACFCVGAGILIFSRKQWVRANMQNLSWGIVGGVSIMLLFTVSTSFRGVIAGALGRDVTLTDRTLIWEEALKCDTNPLIGVGFNSFWMSSKSNGPLRDVYHVPHAHNGYLETYLHTGLIGVLLLITVLVSGGKNATSHYTAGTPIGYVLITIFWVGLLQNYTEVSFSRSNVIGFLLWLVVGFGAANGFATMVSKERVDPVV